MADSTRLLAPFAGLRPASGKAAEIAAPPYDVLDVDEARQVAEGREWSFLRVSRADLEFPDGADPHAPEVYERAGDNLEKMIDAGVMIRDAVPCFYVYRMTAGDHVQTGIVGAASAAAYAAGRIRRHELTRPEKEQDRADQIQAVGAHTGPVMAAYMDDPVIDGLAAKAAAGTPDAEAVTPDGVVHALWVVSVPEDVAAIASAFDRQEAVYVADGHHRAAAAMRVLERRARSGQGGGERFLTVLFPRAAMRILAYHRVVTDLGGMTSGAFLDRLGVDYEVTESEGAPNLNGPGETGLYLGGCWYALASRRAVKAGDPTACIGASVLSARLLGPILGITDPRNDPRVDFVGGARGTVELERLVDSGRARAAFAVYPTSMDDLIAVADSDGIMPPKSTWFEPKLADGMISLVVE